MSAPPGDLAFLEALRGPELTVMVELRPPRADLDEGDAVGAWIDVHHAVRRITRSGGFVFLTDNAVGADEEENLAHLEANLAEEADPERIVPFLTCKHTLRYCLTYAQRAWAGGFRALTVLGGDHSVGPPRCVPHAYVLRKHIRRRVPALALGGWANPHRDAEEQASYLAGAEAVTDFFLTQIVSHHSAARASRLIEAVERSGVRMPGVFGVFYYRSGNPRTLHRLGEFFPVPKQELRREFDAGDTAEEICGRSVAALREAGARNIYVSNLPIDSAARTLERILARVTGPR